jgi:hypothetical protein
VRCIAQTASADPYKNIPLTPAFRPVITNAAAAAVSTAFVSLILPVQPMPVDELPELLRERARLMMFPLSRNVRSHLANIRFRHGEHAVTSSPREFPKGSHCLHLSNEKNFPLSVGLAFRQSG